MAAEMLLVWWRSCFINDCENMLTYTITMNLYQSIWINYNFKIAALVLNFGLHLVLLKVLLSSLSSDKHAPSWIFYDIFFSPQFSFAGSYPLR